MPVETRYFRSDTHRVNGLTAFRLGASNTTTCITTLWGLYDGGYAGIRVFKRDASGNEVEITSGKCVAVVGPIPYNVVFYSSAQWSCPEVSLAPSDAIVVRVYSCTSDGTVGYNITYFITEQLGAYRLNASTWTVFYWFYISSGSSALYFYFGCSTYPSRIEGFSYELAPLMVLRLVGDGLALVVDGTSVGEKACWFLKNA